jgi:hypothetical protein
LLGERIRKNQKIVSLTTASRPHFPITYLLIDQTKKNIEFRNFEDPLEFFTTLLNSLINASKIEKKITVEGKGVH